MLQYLKTSSVLQIFLHYSRRLFHIYQRRKRQTPQNITDSCLEKQADTKSFHTMISAKNSKIMVLCNQKTWVVKVLCGNLSYINGVISEK